MGCKVRFIGNWRRNCSFNCCSLLWYLRSELAICFERSRLAIEAIGFRLRKAGIGFSLWLPVKQIERRKNLGIATMGQLHTELGKSSTLFRDAGRHVCLVSLHTMKYAFVAPTSFCQNCPIINPPDLPTRRRRTIIQRNPLALLVRTDFSPLSPGMAWTREEEKWIAGLFVQPSIHATSLCAHVPGMAHLGRNTCHIKATVGAAATIQGTGRLAYDGSVGLQVSRSRNRRGKWEVFRAGDADK